MEALGPTRFGGQKPGLAAQSRSAFSCDERSMLSLERRVLTLRWLAIRWEAALMNSLARFIERASDVLYHTQKLCVKASKSMGTSGIRKGFA